MNKTNITKLYHSDLRENLINLFNLYLGEEITKLTIDKIKQDVKDIDIYNMMHKLYQKKLKKEGKDKYHSDDYFKKRAKGIAQKMKKYINYHPDGLYLDIGCEDCFIPLSVGRIFSFKDNNIYCVNIHDWESSYELKRDDCNFSFYDGVNLPFEDNSVAIITMFMVIHHVRDINGLLNSIIKKLKKGGIFIIKEHDSISKEFDLLIDIQHYLYDMVMRKEQHIVEDYKSFYYSKDELIKKLSKVGLHKFKEIYNDNPKYNPSNGYFAFFVK
jgi:SAM-dependent methyltransferase